MSAIPSAKLLSTSAYPMETIYAIWKASRCRDEIPEPAIIALQCQSNQELNSEVNEVFEHVIVSDIPVAENLDFIFLIENMPISLREQIVRHRIGHRFGENYGVDIIPGDIQDSWWSQSMRVLDMGGFAVADEYFLPDTIDDREVIDAMRNNWGTAKEAYRHYMKHSADIYRALVGAGVPPEDARQVIPLAATSRMTWKMNFQSLKHILSRRGCWIAQLGMWRPIVEDVVKELAAKVHPIFHELILPPCIKNDKFIGCPFVPDNCKRLAGQDPEPPCPLFLHYHDTDIMTVKNTDRVMMPPGRGKVRWDAKTGPMREKFERMEKAYASLWNRNVWTGALLG